MRTVNQVFLIGNIVKDPMVKDTESGQKMALFTVATNRNWKSKDGEQQTSTEFHNCVAWSNVADIASKYLKKGKLVWLSGYLKTREYDDPETQKKVRRTEIVVLDMILLDRKPKDGEEIDEVHLSDNIDIDPLSLDGIDI